MIGEAPRRIQRSRRPGWRMPPNTVSVVRPGRWGNPFQGPEAGDRYRRWLEGRLSVAEWAAHANRDRHSYGDYQELRAEAVQLRGMNLACWCKPGAACHAEFLLEIANG